ncbi:MAG TPA: cysteine desulfurase-like protein [Verrucomicrobiae bacterium]|nr:cysteine desulfurase-like protein [Verrucomicrobiae bacterium]
MSAPARPPNSSQRTAAIDVNWVRAQFPSLKQIINGHPAAFLDAPAGTQVPQQVIDAFRDYFENSNANTCGAFATSRRTDAMIAGARRAMADFFNCEPAEVFFGPNMTTLTFALARGIGRDLQSGDEIVVTALDHDANVAPWRALEDRGVVIRQVDIHEEDCTLDMADFRRNITPRTKLVAVGYASNAVGTINPVREIIRLAHDAGALAFIDAVHYAPHGTIDVRELDCDFLACSPYKFFGPHMGCIYGKRELLMRFRPYKVRPAPEYLPDRWESGTQIHEGLAGVTASINYMAALGRKCDSSATTRRAALVSAHRAMRGHEMSLAAEMVRGLLAIPSLRFYGISDPSRFAERVPTVAVRLANRTPLECAKFLGDRGIFTWDGNYYALNLTERLGVEKTGGLLRIGLVHYNTAEEVSRLLAGLRELATPTAHAPSH